MNRKRNSKIPQKKTFIALTVLVSVVLFVGILETAVRIRAWIMLGSPFNISLYGFTRDTKTGLKIPVPGSSVGRINVNSLGFRSPELEISKPLHTIRLAFLGGSTTWCGEVSGNEFTWPHLVWLQLQQSYPNLKFDYLNAAVPGYSTKSSLKTLENRVKQFSPDIIFIYHATNDLSYITRDLAVKQGLFSGKVENLSWLSQWSLAWFLIEKNLQLKMRQKMTIEGKDRLRFQEEEISRGFKRTLTALVDASKSVAKIVAVATFSHQLRRDQSPDKKLKAAETAIYYMPYMTVEGILKGFETYNEVIREVVKEKNVLLIGDENRIPGDEHHFNDSVHFTDEGSKGMAQRVIEALKNSPKFQSYVKLREGII